MTGVPTYVVDASVALKWYLPEPEADRAETLLEAAMAGTVALAAPELLLLEVGNACWKHVRRGELSPEEALTALRRLKQSPIRWVPDADLALAALDLASALGCTVYDATYLVLSQVLHAVVVTGDRKLCVLCANAGLDDLVLPLSALEL
jgi:predicted nucleic acid-binding protein